MAQPYVTGPCSVWVGIGSGGSPLFLGHAERTPNIQIRPYFSPIFCDLTGQRVPLDQMYDGEEGLVSLDTTRYNESVYAAIANRARPGTITPRGLDTSGAIGTIMGLEGAAYPLWLRFPYSAKSAMANSANGPMPAGYRFPLAFLQGPDGLDGLGTTNRRLRLNFYCIRELAFDVINSFGNDSQLLYDHDMSAVSGLAIN